MNDRARPDPAPSERVGDVQRTLRALRRAVREALQRHKLAGNPVAVWPEGRVVWIRPEDIPAPSGERDEE